MMYHFIMPNLGKLGDRTLLEVTATDLEKLIRSLSGSCDTAAAQTYKFLGYFFKSAAREHKIRSNPMENVTPRGYNRDQKEEKRRYAMTAEQICSFLYLAKTEEPEFYLPLLLACTTGCRISELIALRFCDIDYQQKCIHINGQLSRPVDISNISQEESVIQRLKTKSAAGVRSVPVPELDEIVLAKERYQKPFIRLKEKMHLPEDFHWHDLRHTFATIMAENEVNLKELANVLGHRTGEFTLQVYVEQKREIHEGVRQYFDLLAGLAGIQTDENRNLFLEKTVNDVEGYTAFLDSFIGDALE